MKGFSAFLKKEFRELIRTKRLLILLCTALIFGIMNPAIAKLTPMLYEMMADELAAQGMTIREITVTAADAWAQFHKNMPLLLIVTLILNSGIYTAEYSGGTLIPLLTKGLSRSAVVLSKYMAMLLTWSAGLWLCWGVTYFYSGYYWDNSAVHSLLFSGVGWWLFGIMLLSCNVFFSAFANSGAQVILGTGAVYFIMMLLQMIGKIKQYVPLRLTESTALYQNSLKPSDCICAVSVTAVLSVLFLLTALPLTRRRQI